MTKLWHWVVARFFPGSIDEYYATREMRREHSKIYRRQANYIVGCLFFIAPLLALAFWDIAPWARKLLVLLCVWGFACIKDAIEEHYCLRLLRERPLATKV